MLKNLKCIYMLWKFRKWRIIISHLDFLLNNCLRIQRLDPAGPKHVYLLY